MPFSIMNNTVFPVDRITQNGISLLKTCFLIRQKNHAISAEYLKEMI